MYVLEGDDVVTLAGARGANDADEPVLKNTKLGVLQFPVTVTTYRGTKLHMWAHVQLQNVELSWRDVK